jgi:hypothetical protein
VLESKALLVPLTVVLELERFVTFDDRRLARRARRLGLAPEIVLAR